MNQIIPKLTDKPITTAQKQVHHGQPFDPDVYAVMEKRDDKLIADNIRYGVSSDIFVYKFPMDGKEVAGITIDGAEHLARHYGGLKHRIVASCHKFGATFKFQSYDPFDVKATIIQELAAQPDYYEVLVELIDTHTGNSRQVTKQEFRMEKRKNSNDYFERKHYTTIAESKAYRNAVLSLVPKDVQEEFKQKCIAHGQSEDIGSSVIDAKRDRCIRYATKHGIAIDRKVNEGLAWEQLSG
ncbi:MAG: hypothetical protein KDE47_30290, partial [Caldilineaceae bacterium]|nr:hypothetical protein [Caldilineaceae bacterium]